MISIEQFCPSETEANMLKDFPASTQGNRSWFDLFQEYIDGIWSRIDHSDSSVSPVIIYMSHADSLQTGPSFLGARRNHQSPAKLWHKRPQCANFTRA